MKMFDINEKTATRDLTDLASRGLMKRTGEKKASRYFLHS